MRLRGNMRILALLTWCIALGMSGEAGGRFDQDMAAFAKADQQSAPTPGGILFTGASGIRLWKTLAEDFAGLPVINRAFGGSTTAELSEYLDRAILPYRPRIVVLQPGSNDLTKGRTPEQVVDDLRTFVVKLRGRLPQVRIIYLGINPSPARWSIREQQQRTNALIADFARTVTDMVYVDLWTSTLDADGQPRADFFIADQLHPSRLAYQMRAEIIRPLVD